MPFLENSIDGNQFDSMEGNVAELIEALELFTRKGIDGTGARKLGQKPAPFALTSVVYVANYAAAQTAIRAYRALTDSDPVPLVLQDTAWGNFLVTKVDPVLAQACLNVVGSIAVDPLVRLVVNWTLVDG